MLFLGTPCFTLGGRRYADDKSRVKRTDDSFSVGVDFISLAPDYGFEAPAHSYELAPLPQRNINYTIKEADARRFLTALDPNSDVFTFQTFTDGKIKPLRDPLQHKWNNVSLDYFLPGALEFQTRNAGVFVQINAGERRRENVTGVRALFIDDDEKGRKLDLNALPPSILIESSPGKHQAYWLLIEAEHAKLDEWKHGQAQLIAAFDTDPKIKNLDRVMRLPGSLHLKNPEAPFRVRIIEYHPERRFAIADVLKSFPAAVRPKKRKVVPQFVDRGELIELADQLKMLDGRTHEDGGFHGECPNADKHSDGKADCLYYVPDPEKGQTVGYVHCFHAHCEDLGPMAMLALLKQKAPRLQTRPERWLADRLKRLKVTYDSRMDTILMDGVPTGLDDFLPILHLDAAADCIKLQLADASFDLWLASQRALARSRFRDTLGWAPDAESRIKAWLYAVTGGNNEIDLAVILHFIWQVKRKLHGLPVEHHMMPIFIGPQNGGKSTAVRKLLEPIALAGLMESCHDLRLIEDDRHVARFATKLVVLCDEMTKVHKTDIAALKGFITEDVASWRVMKTTQTMKSVNLSTFIGTANPDIIDLINDPTGMRRFFEIRCQSKLDWASINALDYLRIWQAVDHRDVSPATPYWAVIDRRQQALTAPNSIDEWLELHCEYGPTVMDWVTAHDAYKVYAQWMSLQRRAPESTASFGRRLGKVGIRSRKISTIRYRMRIPSEILLDTITLSDDKDPE